MGNGAKRRFRASARERQVDRTNCETPISLNVIIRLFGFSLPPTLIHQKLYPFQTLVNSSNTVLQHAKALCCLVRQSLSSPCTFSFSASTFRATSVDSPIFSYPCLSCTTRDSLPWHHHYIIDTTIITSLTVLTSLYASSESLQSTQIFTSSRRQPA